MKTLELGRTRRKQFKGLPENFFDGNNWEATVYSLSSEDLEQKERILEAPNSDSPEVGLNLADWRFLYAALYQREVRKRPYEAYGKYATIETFRVPDSQPWRKIKLLFKELRITQKPRYTWAFGEGQ